MLKKIIRYIYVKLKWKNKIKYPYSTIVSSRSIFEGMNRIYHNSYFSGYLGQCSCIGPNSYIEGKIGKFTSIGAQCNVVIGVHPYTYPFVSISPMFYSTKKQNGYTFTQKQMFEEFKYGLENYPVIIGNDCWIGFGVNLISGIKIGDGAMVLAGSVVTKDIPPYAIVGGIPAKIIKYRYTEDDINYLLKIQWWNKDIHWLRNNYTLLTDFNMLKKNV